MNSPLSVRGVLVAVVAAASCPLDAQGEVCPATEIGTAHILTPGSAQCPAETMSGSTVVSISDNTIIEWDSFNLARGRELEFVFANPQHTVVNRTVGSSATSVSGMLTANGNVVILGPNGRTQVTSSADIRAGSLTVSGLDAEPRQFFSGSPSPGLEFVATDSSRRTMSINGTITTTGGDLLVVGQESVTFNAEVDSAGSVTVVTGKSVSVPRDAPQRASGTGGLQISRIGGQIEAGADIAFITQQALNIAGVLKPGSGRGRVFVRLDEGGGIQVTTPPGQSKPGLTIHGNADFTAGGTMIEPAEAIRSIRDDEGDDLAARSPAFNEFPSLGRSKDRRRTRPSSSVVTARAGSTFAEADERKKQQPALARTVMPLRKRSFFRTRATVTRKRD